jgi:hypothetical protein
VIYQKALLVSKNPNRERDHQMALRAANDSQKWHCNICEKITVHEIRSDSFWEGDRYVRIHTCLECGNQLGTSEISNKEYLELLCVRKSAEQRGEWLESLLEVLDAKQEIDKRLEEAAETPRFFREKQAI